MYGTDDSVDFSGVHEFHIDSTATKGKSSLAQSIVLIYLLLQGGYVTS